MKKFAILAAVVALIGCTQNDEGLDNITSTPEKSQTEFYASMPECDTRTYVEDNKYLRWNAGDEITVFAGNSYNGHWQFAGEDGANSGKFNEIGEGGFVTGTPLDLTANYAIYPYDENITISESGVVSLTLPAVQEYNHTYANSFGAGANTMMAVTKNTSDNFLAFKNLCGYLKLKFYGEDVTVKSITVKGNNGEKIAGPATVSMAYGNEPTITMGNNATDTITIDCGEGVALSNDAANPTIFWVVIPEITFEGGITIEVTDINDQIFKKKTTNAVPIENNLIQPMAALGVEAAPAVVKPANNEIWYTATSQLSVSVALSKTNFGANIVKHTWNSENGKGIMIFDSDVTLIGDHAFKNRSMLTSITIPDSVKKIGYQAFWECSNLTKINIPQNVSSFGDNAFYHCTGEITISCNIPHYERSYTDSPFRGSRFSKIIIQDGVTSIGMNAFRNIYSVRSIVIPTSVTTIGKYAFAGLNRLEEIECDFVSDDGKCMIINGTLRFFAPFGIKEYTIPNEVSFIETNAFYGFEELEKVTIPSSVKHIGNAAFGNCSNLKEIILTKGVETIGKRAFYGTAITSITFPYSVKSIGSGVICRCENLLEIKGAFVSADNKYICVDDVFVGLVQAGVTEFEIPEGITTIGESAFDYTYNLEVVTLPSTINKVEWAFYQCDALKVVYCKAATPPAVYNGALFAFPCPDTESTDIIFYVPEKSYSAYTQYNALGGWGDTISPANWYRVKDCIQPYAFQ